MTSLELDLSFDPPYGACLPVAPGVSRVTAPNSGPFTFRGTNSYLIGEDRLLVLDPGPEDEAHLAALVAAIAGRPVEAILLTHTHRDHTALAPRLKALTGAPILAEGRHRAARARHDGEAGGLDAGGDRTLHPDRLIGDGERLEAGDVMLRAIATPGHTANHLAFALEGAATVLTGDHVMGWSTTVVAPPDGSMADYMASLDLLATRDDALYLPGHGGPIHRPGRFLRALKAHRRMREAAILERLRSGDRTIGEIVAAIYRGLDPRLSGAARLSVLAHLEDLVQRGLVLTEGPPLIGGLYEPA